MVKFKGSLKNKKMRDLSKVRRRKIIVQRLTVGEDEWGNQTRTWVDWRTLWAERNSLWGQEYFAAKAVNEENTIEFIVRHVGFLEEVNTVDFRIVVDGRTYDIKNIDLLKDDGMWIKFRCLERGANG